MTVSRPWHRALLRDLVYEEVTRVSSALTSVSVDLAVVVLDELLDEGAVLVQDLVPHVGDVVKHRLVFHLDRQTDRQWGRERRANRGSLVHAAGSGEEQYISFCFR